MIPCMHNKMTAVHELFHALGFSNKLFDKFRKCDEVGVCEPWPQPIVRPVDGVMRLVTGAVVRQMSKHFNCSSESDFGGPLEVEGDSVTSHWDGLLMHSSIMGSKEQKPYQTLIDPISLAVFEDTGWYKVNYSQADKFMWGQDKGCSFGLPNFCKQHEGICLQNVTGCHHLRLSKARCNVNTKIPSSCGVFAADQIPCFITPVNSTSFDDETLSSSSRCFLSSLRPAYSYSSEKNASFLNLIGKCYERKCEKDQYYLRVNGGDWLLCVPESYIQVQGFEGNILCANYDIVCSDFIHPEPQLEFVASSTPVNLLTISQDIRTPWNRIEASVTYSLLEGGARPAKSFFCPVALVIGIIASIFVDFLS
uniref:Leishmanolysin-like peptidase n=1 Tax=Arion vulgaris TaxID=1028688 RepID=A0A0B6Z383_9EUPU